MFRGISLLTGTLFFLSLSLQAGESRLINGKPVEPGTWQEVVNIFSGGASCTATVVGPRVIITAAHCAKTGATATFKVNGRDYSATITRSSLYPQKDHDVAIGVTSQEISGIEPATIGGTAVKGNEITLLGFGCTEPGGGGGNDGTLRIGKSAIVGFSEYDMVSRMPNGSALCYGDSGGPSFSMEGGKKLLLGINSKGNIQDTNYNTRLDMTESKDFMKQVASSNGVDICGVNSDCSSDPSPNPPACTLSASPNVIQLGQSTRVTLFASGEVTSGKINNQSVSVPSGFINIAPTSAGTQWVQGQVTGPGGTASCQTSFIVEKDDPITDPPTCQLTASPDIVKLGSAVTLSMSTQGQVTSATIDGKTVPYPVGKIIVTATKEGSNVALGRVTGPGGNSSCSALYDVEDGGGPGPDPSIPNFSIVPTYCGDNEMNTDIQKVCISIVKRDTSIQSMRVSEVVSIKYRNGQEEVLPIVTRTVVAPQPGDIQVKENWHLYANNAISAKNYKVLDVRSAIVTKLPKRSGEVPRAIEGRCAKGQYFKVRNLKAFSVSN